MIVELCKHSLATISASFLTFFFNHLFDHENVPDVWTEATIQFLLKKSDVIQPDNYCVVSLLNIDILGYCVCVCV